MALHPHHTTIVNLNAESRALAIRAQERLSAGDDDAAAKLFAASDRVTLRRWCLENGLIDE